MQSDHPHDMTLLVPSNPLFPSNRFHPKPTPTPIHLHPTHPQDKIIHYTTTSHRPLLSMIPPYYKQERPTPPAECSLPAAALQGHSRLQ